MELLREKKKEGELKTLENPQPIHIAKYENSKGVVNRPF